MDAEQNSARGSGDARAEASATEQRLSHLPYLDGLRAVAAFSVLINHLFQQVYWTEQPRGFFREVAPWLQFGHISVILFIVLSGFCLMRPVVERGGLRGGAWEFYKSRARRILPAYWAAMAVALLLVGTVLAEPQGAMSDISLHVTAASVLGHLLLVQNLMPPTFSREFGDTTICSVFWSVGVEWQIYFLFPLIVFGWRRWGGTLTLALVGLLAFDGWRWVQGRDWLGVNWQGINPDFYAYFALGMLAAVVAFSPKAALRLRRLPWPWLAAALLAGFAVLCWRQFYGYDWLASKQFDVYCAPMFACLLVAASRPGLFQRVLSWRPLASVGTYSYSIYLLHLPIAAVLTKALILPYRDQAPPLALFLLLVSVGIPLILWLSARFAGVFENRARLTALLSRGRLSGQQAPLPSQA